MKFLRTFCASCLAAFTLLPARGGDAPSSVVISIRYLQREGTSHAHLYLFDGEAKRVRRLTNDEAGQDHDPVFSPDGSAIVYQRTLKEGEQCRQVSSAGDGDQRIGEVPKWYGDRDGRPARFNYPAAVPTPEGGRRLFTAGKPGDIAFKTKDGKASIVLKDGAVHPADPNDPSWYPKIPFLHEESGKDDVSIETFSVFSPTREKNVKEFWTAPLPQGNVPHEPQSNEGHGVFGEMAETVLLLENSPFLEAEPMRVAFFSQHRGSTEGEGLFAFDLKTRNLFELAPNGGSIIPMPGLPWFACVCEQRYLPMEGFSSVNCDYLDLWDAGMRRIRFAEKKPARFCGASILFVGESKRVISISKVQS